MQCCQVPLCELSLFIYIPFSTSADAKLDQSLMSTKRPRIPLSDEDYLAAKARAATSKADGDGFEVLIAMLFILRAAIRSTVKSCGNARQGTVHLYNGEFVDDLKVALDARQTTRFIHAKSGPNVYWKRNLIRDFKSQSDRAPKGADIRLELWLTS